MNGKDWAAKMGPIGKNDVVVLQGTRACAINAKTQARRYFNHGLWPPQQCERLVGAHALVSALETIDQEVDISRHDNHLIVTTGIGGLILRHRYAREAPSAGDEWQWLREILDKGLPAEPTTIDAPIGVAHAINRARELWPESITIEYAPLEVGPTAVDGEITVSALLVQDGCIVGGYLERIPCDLGHKPWTKAFAKPSKKIKTPKGETTVAVGWSGEAFAVGDSIQALEQPIAESQRSTLRGLVSVDGLEEVAVSTRALCRAAKKEATSCEAVEARGNDKFCHLANLGLGFSGGAVQWRLFQRICKAADWPDRVYVEGGEYPRLVLGGVATLMGGTT